MAELIGPDDISKVREWRRSTPTYGIAQRFAEMAGEAVINWLGEKHAAIEIVNFIGRVTADFLKLPGNSSQGLDERGSYFQEIDLEIARGWLTRAFIPPLLAAKHGIFNLLYGDLVESGKDWYPELNTASQEDIVNFFQHKYETKYFPPKE